MVLGVLEAGWEDLRCCPATYMCVSVRPSVCFGPGAAHGGSRGCGLEGSVSVCGA